MVAYMQLFVHYRYNILNHTISYSLANKNLWPILSLRKGLYLFTLSTVLEYLWEQLSEFLAGGMAVEPGAAQLRCD